MQRFVFILLFMACMQKLFAQSCGSDTSYFASPGLLNTPGCEPSDKIPAVINDSATNILVEVVGPGDTLNADGQHLIADSVTINAIYNLPEGLCWWSNFQGGVLRKYQDGCFKITGTTCVAPGQYTIRFMGILYLGGAPISSEIGGFFLRVINKGDTVPAIDTTGCAEYNCENMLYGTPASCVPAGISDIDNNNVTIKTFPNPFNDVTHIEVTGISNKFSFELYDVTGRLQQTIPSINTTQFELHKAELANGVYLYRILVTGKPVAYGKLVLE